MYYCLGVAVITRNKREGKAGSKVAAAQKCSLEKSVSKSTKRGVVVKGLSWFNANMVAMGVS